MVSVTQVSRIVIIDERAMGAVQFLTPVRLDNGVDAGPAARLRSVPGIQHVPDSRVELFILRGFADEHICRALTALIDERRRPSDIADDIGIANYRTSETCDLDPGDSPVNAVDRKICDLLGLPRGVGEPLQGQRYDRGQEFRLHTDTFEPGGLDYHLHCASSGQRTWTAMLYLNEPELGGATRFKVIGKTIQPETGKLLVWNNLLPTGKPNPATLHQGMKVRSGVKYVLTKWFRERPWPGR